MKHILDPCCGGKMFYFNKDDPRVLFCDERYLEARANDGRKFEVAPDVVCDFTALPFLDDSFVHVVFDPPQLLYAGGGGQMALHYGKLPTNWQSLIRDGFNECWRVLAPYGTLIFKWSEHDIPLKKVLEAIDVTGREPLYGHKSGKQARTHWLAFVKIPEGV